MFKILIICVIFFCIHGGNTSAINSRSNDTLLSVVAIFRHGARTTVDVYPNDPYKDISYWPDGFGQLTNEGRQQQYDLGKWLRERYDSFLPAKYSQYDIRVKSSDIDRTLMSAQCNLAGLYPPKEEQIWLEGLNWQPIPVHTLPTNEDAIISQDKSCPKYNQLLEALLKTEYFQKIEEDNKEMYAELSEFTGQPINSIEEIRKLYYTLYSEEHFNYTLPSWTSKYYPDALLPLAGLAFATRAYTPGLARLKTGPLLNEIITHFVNITENVGNTYQKFQIYSAHDSNIVNMLNAMGALTPHWPKTASCLLLELKQGDDSSDFYVDVFYKQEGNVTQIKVRGCDVDDCAFSKFVEALKPVTIDPDTWETECNQI